MKEKYIIEQLRNEIEAATSVDSRTTGGDTDAAPPEVVIDWNATRLPNFAGANNLGGYATDQSGDKTGFEFHQYYQMHADCIARSYDEEESTDLANAIQDAFSPYEFNTSDFDEDTAEWEIGNASPRGNPVIEPDWYEIGVLVEFVFVRKATQDADTLDTINKDTDIDVTLDDGEITTKTT